MRGRQHQAAAGEVRIDNTGQHLLPGLVEGGGGLVQQPDRAPGQQQPQQAGAPPLAGREVAGRDVAQALQSEGGQRRIEPVPPAPRRLPMRPVEEAFP